MATHEPPRGFVLISIDTLRADHLGLYGYERDTSPFLDSLAERSIVFDLALAPIPRTLPSHMSMFTGLYPAEHGVYPPDGKLAVEIPTLPSLFHEAGFRTGGFTEGGFVSGHYGFARGFELFDDDPKDWPRAARTTFAKAMSFLEELEPEDRFFLFLHTFQVHDPYHPPEEYRESFWPKEAPEVFDPTGPNLGRFNCGHESLSDEELSYFTALYDAEIRFVDDVIRGFFAKLDELGLSEETVVLITSDHGEEFLEHRLLSHFQAYHHNLRVPLMVVMPHTVDGRRHAAPVRLIDIAPTLLELAGIEPDARATGRSLVPYLRGGDGHLDRIVAVTEGAESRGLYWQSQARLYHLVERRANTVERAQSGLWVTPRGISFGARGKTLRFDARSYSGLVELQIAVDGALRSALELDETWRSVEVELGDSETIHPVLLASDDCTPVVDGEASGDCRCLSFRVRGLSLEPFELYAVDRDPLETTDLVAAQAPVGLEGVALLAQQRLEPVATAGKAELAPELVEQLKALGYLQ